MSFWSYPAALQSLIRLSFQRLDAEPELGSDLISTRLTALLQLEVSLAPESQTHAIEDIWTRLKQLPSTHESVGWSTALLVRAQELSTKKLTCLIRADTVEKLHSAEAVADVRAAADCIHSLSIRKPDLCELRAMARPPDGILQVLSACGVLLQGEPPSMLEWKKCKQMLTSQRFLTDLKTLDPGQVSERQLAFCVALSEEPLFNYEMMRRRGLAVAELV
ncbi:unnamed protein product [Polarella glacialis]|uniref:Dynein heavy chain coiled coil stalk domain-containing protein n=1 Tax=Polarella glacialis TaxID=89957 RepID=A0A813J5T3_POLGL|nr:unnamed protein product [Polarella glacialis]